MPKKHGQKLKSIKNIDKLCLKNTSKKLRNTKEKIKNRSMKDEKTHIIYPNFNDSGYNLQTFHPLHSDKQYITKKKNV